MEKPRRAGWVGAAFGVSPNVLVAGLVSLLTDISSEMIYPVLPLFLTQVLGAPVAAIGLIEGIAESTASLLKTGSGWLSDRLQRRKPLMLLGYGFSNLIKPLLALTTSWPQVLGLRFLDRAGKGVRSGPRDALIADSSDENTRGRAFGLHRAMDTAGAAAGPLLAFAVLAAFPNRYRLVFWVSAVPGILSVLILAVFLRERIAKTHEARPQVRFRHLGRRYGLFLVVAAVFSIGNSSDAFLILRARSLGLSNALIPLAYFAFNIAYSLMSTPCGVLSDRMSRKWVIALGYAVFAFTYLGLALARGSAAVWVLFVVYGLYYALTEGVCRAFVADITPAHLRGSAMGTFAATTGLALLPASLMGGFLWQSVGPEATFFYGAGTAALAAVMILFV